MRIVAVIFEGGQATHWVTRAMVELRQSIVVDTIDKLQATGEIDEIILYTNYPALRSKLENRQVTLANMEGPFHFGRWLQHAIQLTRADGVLCMGGAAAPFMSTQEFRHMARSLRAGEAMVLTNNPQSSDIVAFSPAQAAIKIDLPERDNELANILRDQAGLNRVLLSHSIGVHFDLDTPTDALLMSLSPRTGEASREFLQRLNWNTSAIERAINRMEETHCELGLVGRVNPAVMTHINTHTFCRLRVYSEERGMKALRREEEGKVVSLMGHIIEQLGSKVFFDYLSQTCDVVFFDTRVLFAHLKLHLSEEERFLSDLGLWQEIDSPVLREFTRAATEAKIPIVLGGHSLVTGGMWAIIDMMRTSRKGI